MKSYIRAIKQEFFRFSIANLNKFQITIPKFQCELKHYVKLDFGAWILGFSQLIQCYETYFNDVRCYAIAFIEHGTRRKRH